MSLEYESSNVVDQAANVRGAGARLGNDEVGVLVADHRAADAVSFEPRFVDESPSGNVPLGRGLNRIAKGAPGAVIGHWLAGPFVLEDAFDAVAHRDGVVFLQREDDRGDNARRQVAVAISKRQIIGRPRSELPIEVHSGDRVESIAELTPTSSSIHAYSAANRARNARHHFQTGQSTTTEILYESEKIYAC